MNPFNGEPNYDKKQRHHEELADDLDDPWDDELDDDLTDEMDDDLEFDQGYQMGNPFNKKPYNNRQHYKKPRYNKANPYNKASPYTHANPYKKPNPFNKKPSYSKNPSYSKKTSYERNHGYESHTNSYESHQKVEVRQNYDHATEAYINKQINMELNAANEYLSMSAYYSRSDVALPGFAAWFKNASNEERDHADKLINYQNLRGGTVKLWGIKKPSKIIWGCVSKALEACLHLEKRVNASLIKLDKIAGEKGDAQLCIQSMLDEQVESIKEIGDLITKLKRVGLTTGLYLIDKELQETGKRQQVPM